MMRPVLVFTLLVFAGCAGPATEPTMGGIQAADAAAAAVDGEFEYLLYLGTTGTEGPLNWTAYEQALAASMDPGAKIAEAFDQDVDNGATGDGALASWLTTHFVFDGERRLLGGLYTQTTPDGTSSVYAPFRGPYAGTLALPSLQQQSASRMLALEAAQEGNTTLCGLISGTQELRIDSTEAADIAAQRGLMQAHVEDVPDGEFTYYYFPKLDVEPGCPAELNVRSNYWVISHADLDAYLDGGVPTVAEVVVDAATGEVLDEGLRPVFNPAPTVIDHVIKIQDPLIPSTRPTEETVPFLVKAGSARLDITALRTQGPSSERDGYTRLLDPSGREWGSHPSSELMHEYDVRDPAAGEWRLEYVSYGLEPGADHEVRVRGVVHHV